MGHPRHDRFTKRLQSLAKYARILSHPARIQILEYLMVSGDSSVMELRRQIPLSQPTVSQHLALLKREGIIKYYEVTPRIFYSIDEEQYEKLASAIKKFSKSLGHS